MKLARLMPAHLDEFEKAIVLDTALAEARAEGLELAIKNVDEERMGAEVYGFFDDAKTLQNIINRLTALKSTAKETIECV
jgi:hypothetical protein